DIQMFFAHRVFFTTFPTNDQVRRGIAESYPIPAASERIHEIAPQDRRVLGPTNSKWCLREAGRSRAEARRPLAIPGVALPVYLPGTYPRRTESKSPLARIVRHRLAIHPGRRRSIPRSGLSPQSSIPNLGRMDR